MTAEQDSFKKDDIVSFKYNDKQRVVVVDRVAPKYIIGKNKDGFKCYRFDRMQSTPIVTMIS